MADDATPSDIREVARAAAALVDDPTPAWLARVVAWRGFGGRRQGEALLYADAGAVSGSLLGGLAETDLRELMARGPARSPVHVFDLAIGDGDAVSAGLACGGLATVLATELKALPPALDAFRRGRPVAIVTSLPEADGKGATLVVTEGPESGRLVRRGTLGEAALDDLADSLARTALRQGRDVSEVRTEQGRRLVVEAYLPTTTMVVVGEGALTESLEAQGALLGWRVEVVAGFGRSEGELVAALGPADAVVVLSHDPEVDTPALAQALRAGCYVGALGSRHTQAGRRERLHKLGFDGDSLSHIHGPVGLDLGTRTPEETALAIAAEILAHRSGREALSLRDTSGPVNG
jgi:xanthine dehydrogenase accessory factor